MVNVGIGDAAQNSKGLEAAMKDLAQITGQRPVKTRARQSIATFKLREGQTVGIAVTLRGNVSKLFLVLLCFSLFLSLFACTCGGFLLQSPCYDSMC